ncbi:MAG: hypothetical protein HYU64_15775 [Armatimonadetes bacterium]|nr:hypothetical protein [Armatimonadota bacterium]
MRKISLLLGFLLLCAPPAFSQTGETKPLAIVSQIDGKVFIKREGKEIPAQLGMACYDKDEIKVSSGQAVLYFLTGKIRPVNAPHSIEINEEIVRSLGSPSSPASDLVRHNEELFSGRSRQSAKIETATGGLRAGQGVDAPAALLHPARTILTAKPVFQWTYGKVPPSEDLVLAIEDDKANVVSQKRITPRQTSLPCPISLVPGNTYTWCVRGISQQPEDVDSQIFTVAPEPKAREYLDLKQSLKKEGADEVTLHLILAKHAERLDLISEAVDHWKAVSKAHPKETLPHKSLIELYRMLGLKREHEKEKSLLEALEKNK